MATVAPDPLEDLTSQGVLDGLYEVIDDRVVAKAMGAYEYWPRESFSGCSTATPTRTRSVGPSSRWSSTSDLKSSASGGRTWLRLLFERWARDRRITRARSWAVIPDLAVEIISLTNTADEVAEKLEEYFRVGVRQVWVVYPRQSKVYVYRSTTAVQVLAPGDELEGGDLLPGFRLSGREVFEKAGEPA